MRRLGLHFWSIGLLAAGILWFAPRAILAQTNAPEPIQGQAGIAVDAEGVLRVKTFGDPGGSLMRQRIAAAKASLDPKLASFSNMRKVSLNRLERGDSRSSEFADRRNAIPRRPVADSLRLLLS